MPIVSDEYVPRTRTEIQDELSSELLAQQPNANPRSPSTYTWAMFFALAATISQQQEQSLEGIYNSSFVRDATEEALTKKAANLGVKRRESQRATGVVTFSRSSAATQDYVIPSGTIVETLEEDAVQFETTESDVIRGPSSETDSNTYSTTNTSLTTQTSLKPDPEGRDSIDLSVDVRTTNSTYAASITVIDVTNSNTIIDNSTTNTSFSTFSATYNTSSFDDPITIEYQLASGDGSTSVELTDAAFSAGGGTEANVRVRAVDGGSDGNVGPNSIQAMPSKPTGVEEVNNNQATGDPTLTDTNGDPLIEGRDRETDAQLRERVSDRKAIAESPSEPGIGVALENVTNITDKKLIVNDTDSVVDGLDPYTTEVICFGGNTLEITQTLRDVLSVTTLLRLQGGVNGTKETETVQAPLLDQEITVPITRPTEDAISDVDINIVHTSAYAGDSDVKDAVVKYVGGTLTDASTATGVGIGENVLINEIENICEDMQGVDYADVTFLDSDGDGTDDTTTDSDGVPVYSVASTDVARLDETNITFSKTAR